MNKILVQLLVLVFLNQIFVPVFCQTCTSSQIWDFKLNKCIPNIDCLKQLNDDPKCLTLDCATNGDICPKKCYCQQPSALTNYCIPCLNGGVLNKSTCECTCSYGFQGPRCQYQPDPCKAQDDVFCSNVNCYNASDSDFFRCPVKCMCCKNTECKNLGKLKNDCSCECLTLNDSAGTDLKVYTSPNCERVACADDHACATQFLTKTKPENCNNIFVKTLCPKSCKVCI
ncbi:unnamed protein product [Brachionus calyciflorus]|uniref:EGF-like domain-containing protein n=1 Tax=Brachionus calyciflorus TaxID=104777 RepID=A0A814LDU5_9BILA|nr:unnamed protein product [Brachionus calyciflorus]